MGTREQPATTPATASASSERNANTTHPPQPQPPQEHVYLPEASPPPQVIIIPATQASTVATNAARKIRRAFSMPRNPFRWSRKFKTSTAAADSESSTGGSNSAITACVGGGRGRAGSIVSLNSYEAVICKDSNGQRKDAPQQDGAPVEAADADKAANEKNDKKSGKLAAGNGAVDSANGGANRGVITGTARVLRRSSFRKFLNRIAQHVSASVNVGANKHASFAVTTDRVPPIGGYQWAPDQTPGVMGLKNHGNTCFMNAVLQCLSHTDILAEYFVLDQYKADLKRRNKINSRKFGTKGELTEQLANVLKALWTCKNESDHSTSFKAVVDRYGSQFRSSTQHDAQEFLFWLLDKVHEDLNTATKRRYKSMKQNSYGRSDEIIAAETLANHIRCNNSFVQAVFQAQFRSSLTCPRCEKQSNTFDPFHCISVQLPQLTQQTVFVTVVYLKQQPRQVKLGVQVPAGSPIVALRDQLRNDTGIPSERMVLVDINKEGFTRVYYDTQPVATLNGVETIYCMEVPEARLSNNKTNSSNNTTATTATNESNPSNDTARSSAPKQGNSTELLLLIANVRKKKKDEAEGEGCVLERFGIPFSMQAPRDTSYNDLKKKLLKEMSALLKPEVFAYTTPLTEMFQLRLQDPSADPDTYLEQVEHPLLTEMIDLALSVLSAEAGPLHIKLLLEWPDPERYFTDLTDHVEEHESVARLRARQPNDVATLTLEQCLEHYTKAEMLSAEDAWRCPHCQQYLPVVKTLGLWSLPDILVVHFKRFRQHHDKGANSAKLTTMVKFPLNSFDMAPHLARGPNEDEHPNFFVNSNSNFDSTFTSVSQLYRAGTWKKSRNGDSRSSTLNSRDNRETRYDLYAVCYHQGDTLETGHYTAACKNPYDRQWYKFDDQRVSKVPSENIEDEIINNEAYMLFYQRRVGDGSECSGSSSNSGDHWVSRIGPVEKISVPSNEKVKDEVVLPVSKVVVATKMEKIPERPELRSVETPPPIAAEIVLANAEEDEAVADVAPTTVAAEPVVAAKAEEKLAVDVEKIDYADADADVILVDEVQVLGNSLPVQDIEAPSAEVAIKDIAVVEELKQQALATTNGVKLTNGYHKTITNGVGASLADIKSASNSESSASSTSSLSSCASPHSLAVSIHGASTLQNKFNGFLAGAASSAAHKEALLSSSLKSNSSSIIGAAIAAHSQEFQLSQHQHNHWNGSRSSVSAVENATQQCQPQAQGLNLRHSFSTSSNYKFRECSETLSSMLRNSANTCSKDTLIFIDQQNHHHHHRSLMEDEDDSSFMGSRSLWISPVTPHKLITVSPKN